MKKTLALVGALAASSCVSVDTDSNEVAGAPTGAVVEFDPGNSIIPFPNNLLLNRTTGKLNLPEQCGETVGSPSMLLRAFVLNALDGFGTYQPGLRMTVTKPVKVVNGVPVFEAVLIPRVVGGTPVAPAMATPVPLTARAGKTVRFSADCSSNTLVDTLVLIPLQPLQSNSVYSVALLSATAEDDTQFKASSTWGLVRQKDNPVVINEAGEIVSETTPLNPYEEEDKATLVGLDLLWKAHAQGLAFLEATGKARADMLLAWEFKTQTTTLPLDPAVSGTPAFNVPKAKLTAVGAVTDNVVNHMTSVLVGAFGAPATICDAPPAGIGCASVGSVINGTVTTPNYQSLTANPIGGKMIPGPWSSPVTPTKIGDNTLEARILIPSSPRPANGYPAVVFGHGLGGNRIFSYLIGPQLARAGFAVVSIDFVAHGDRAVRISNTGDCVDVGGLPPSPSAKPACYVPIFSTNLAATRDNIRQSVLDVQTLIQSLKLCTEASPCGAGAAEVRIDPAKIGYIGISLGGIIGATITATSPDIKAATLSVPAVGLVDVLENTKTLTIKCSLVDGLIDAGIVMGTKWNKMEGAAATGTCTTDEWLAQPGYQSFSALARIVLDPADGANFAVRLRAKRFLIQKVTDDLVVPNIGTDRMAAIAGVPMSADADNTLPPTAASPAITTEPKTNKFVKYTNAADMSIAYSHGSLLNGGATQAFRLGTARVQLDAITYLVLNIIAP